MLRDPRGESAAKRGLSGYGLGHQDTKTHRNKAEEGGRVGSQTWGWLGAPRGTKNSGEHLLILPAGEEWNASRICVSALTTVCKSRERTIFV